jgi:hypothetical protein
MRKPKRPELKMPEVKVPAFLADLYYDLRDRRLLPLIALVVVAIAAVPFLLGGGSEEVNVPAPGGGAAAIGPAPAKASRLTVVEATPGLRDYHTRLGDRSPTNPFKQRYTSLPGSAQVQSAETTTDGGAGGSSTGTVNESTTTAPEGSSAGSGTSGGADGGSGGGGNGGGAETRLIEFVFDVQVSHTQKTADGGQKMSEPEVRRRVPTLAQLPGKKTAVVTVAGINLHNGKVWFLVSDDVSSLDGDFTCVTRTPGGLCELVEVEVGFPLELAYEAGEDGSDEVRYRIKVTKIDAVWAGEVGDESRSSRASFGGSAAAVPSVP